MLLQSLIFWCISHFHKYNIQFRVWNKLRWFQFQREWESGKIITNMSQFRKIAPRDIMLYLTDMPWLPLGYRKMPSVMTFYCLRNSFALAHTMSLRGQTYFKIHNLHFLNCDSNFYPILMTFSHCISNICVQH